MCREHHIIINSFQLDSGDESGDIEVACCLYGSAEKPVVAVLGGISASRWAMDCPQVNQKGWWQDVLSQVASSSLADCCFLTFEYFSFAEKRVNPPVISTADQAVLLNKIQNQLKLPRFHAVIGSSYGGMVALSFASKYPDALLNLVCIAAADHNSVKSQALRQIQRSIIELGQTYGKDSQDRKNFVALARSLAMVGYRGEIEFEQRFQSPIPGAALAEVDSYLNFHGQRFADAFSLSRYLQLSQSIDFHQVNVSSIKANTLLIGITSDQLIPIEFIEQMGQKISANCQISWIDSIYGHDGFLLEAEQLNQLFNTFFREDSHDYFERNHRCASGY